MVIMRGLGVLRLGERGSFGIGVLGDITRICEEIEGLGIEFASSFEGVVGNGRDLGVLVR